MSATEKDREKAWRLVRSIWRVSFPMGYIYPNDEKVNVAIAEIARICGEAVQAQWKTGVPSADGLYFVELDGPPPLPWYEAAYFTVRLGTWSLPECSFGRNVIAYMGIPPKKGGDISTAEPKPPTTCAWVEEGDGYNGIGVWDTACGKAFVYDDGSPSDNGARFCQYCGKPIEQVDYEREEEEDEDEEKDEGPGNTTCPKCFCISEGRPDKCERCGADMGGNHA